MLGDQPWDEKWSALVSRLVGRSPPGQLAEVLAGCNALTRATIPDELVARACCEHNERAMLVLPIAGAPEGATGIVCEEARQGSRGQRLVPYYDPRSDTIFTVDQEKQECVSSEKRAAAGDLQAEMAGLAEEKSRPYREAVQEAMDRYLSERYAVLKQGRSAVVVFASKPQHEDGIELRVSLSSRESRPRGFWVGSWSSQWRTVFKPDHSDFAMLGGVIEFMTCYSEDGNVHFRRKSVRKAKIDISYTAAKFAANFAATIAALEDEFHAAAEEQLLAFGNGALKAVRRVLPISKERFDWRPMRHALVRDMKAAGKEAAC